jgi:hypothetical protein
LQLDTLSGVPESWPSGNYDYFWIVGYGSQGSGVPTRAPYDKLPANDWGAPNGLKRASGCDLKGASE